MLIVPGWSLKNKELFRIGLVDQPRVGGVRPRLVDPKRGITFYILTTRPYWWSALRCDLSTRGAKKQGTCTSQRNRILEIVHIRK